MARTLPLQENIDTFDMSPEEALQSAIEEFTLQGVDLAGIIRVWGEARENHPMAQACTKLLERCAPERGVRETAPSVYRLLRWQLAPPATRRLKASRTGDAAAADEELSNALAEITALSKGQGQDEAARNDALGEFRTPLAEAVPARPVRLPSPAAIAHNNFVIEHVMEATRLLAGADDKLALALGTLAGVLATDDLRYAFARADGPKARPMPPELWTRQRAHMVWQFYLLFLLSLPLQLIYSVLERPGLSAPVLAALGSVIQASSRKCEPSKVEYKETGALMRVVELLKGHRDMDPATLKPLVGIFK